ncbi:MULTISPECIES: response regulator transcription factor [Hydrogenophaga]|uniref:response regulator transcription factor n=1 Tax=Hydrogenophaga TaxID=47420 RepID=UPI001CFB26EF|nr:MULTISPECIES: response regulator transcription factor [Hydrogenophaga]MDO9029645.1 response regulator transcription factor [Hydrogenophaga sp.]MDP2019425.1 response regulator transcription factor [Hydrogenophaga sp.]
MTPRNALVHVVDDDLSMREAVSSLLRSFGLRVETYALATDFLNHYVRSKDEPECLVLDVRMPGLSGLELQRQLQPLQHQLPIVFITAHGDIPMTVRAMKAGAMEFLPKPFRDQDLLDAIEASLERSRAALRERETIQVLKDRYGSLTPREREVLTLLAQGLRNKQTADRMGISEVTVKVHRHNLMEKMQAGSVPMLISMLEQLRPAIAERPRAAD